MGAAIDQLMMTLAYDPKLKNDYYELPGMKYDPYSFFDRWNGHSWATGVAPGIEGPNDADDLSIWKTRGKGNYPFNDENENSIWEGLQAWSSMILWGGATRRKAVVDQGIYLLATGNAAADMYFLDKNYNLKAGPENLYSWCPVTTGDPESGDKSAGGNTYHPNSSYSDSNPEAFYGEASPGVSTLYKDCIGLNNFFYAYPTGSKAIQAFPASAWTLGIARNTTYMKKWAAAMQSPEWQKAKDSELYSASDWMGLAMASALCGVPQNPGDDPSADTYINRLWSDWVTRDQAVGSMAASKLKNNERPLTVLHFLHALDVYGTPDWTIIAKVVDAQGQDADQEIVFTAAFSKLEDQKLRTSLVAFNPNWENKYVNFYRLGEVNGRASLDQLSPAINPEGPILVTPKKMVVLQLTNQ